MAEYVARSIRIGVGGVPPVVVVVGGHAIPAAVMGLDGRMGPVQSGVVGGQHDPLAGVAQRPNLVGSGEGDVGSDGCGSMFPF